MDSNLYLVSLNTFLFRDFVIIINQLKLWVLTTDVAYLKNSSLRGFSILIKKYKTEFQVIEDICAFPRALGRRQRGVGEFAKLLCVLGII